MFYSIRHSELGYFNYVSDFMEIDFSVDIIKLMSLDEAKEWQMCLNEHQVEIVRVDINQLIMNV